MKFIPGGRQRYEHQRVGLNHILMTRGVSALLFDPGTGKTATTIDYACILALKLPSQEARVLVVAPLAAVDTWVLQMEEYAAEGVNFWAEVLGGSLLDRAASLAARGGRLFTKDPLKKPMRPGVHPKALNHEKAMAFASRPAVDPRKGPDAVPGPKIVMAVTNIDTFSRRDRVGSQTMADVMVDAIKRFRPDLVVVDESHKIKSAMGNASRLLGRVTKFVPRRMILTGTVMPHSPLDVYGQWRFLQPEAFGTVQSDGTRKTATFGGFKSRFAKLGGWMGKEVVGFHRLDEMQRIMAENAMVVRKEDALDLPPTTDVTIQVDLSPAEKKAYADMRDQLAAQLAKGVLASATNRLTQMLRLRQITSGHLPDDTGTTREIGRSKVNVIRSLVHDTLAGEKRVVVFGFFTHEIQQLTTALAQKGTIVRVISGGTPTQERMAIRKEFGSDDPKRIVLVAQIKTLSLAVNELVTANHAVFASLSQQRDDYIQARDRLDRIGQTRPVTFWHVLAPGTVDEVILKSHKERTDLETAVLEHIRDSR